MGTHVIRATAATNALDNGADILKSRSGWVMPILPQSESMITTRPGQIVRHLRFSIRKVGRMKIK